MLIHEKHANVLQYKESKALSDFVRGRGRRVTPLQKILLYYRVGEMRRP